MEICATVVAIGVRKEMMRPCRTQWAFKGKVLTVDDPAGRSEVLRAPDPPRSGVLLPRLVDRKPCGIFVSQPPLLATRMDDVEQHHEWLVGLVDMPNSGMLVDLGCGRGYDVRLLAERHRDPASTFLGLDASEKHIDVARSACSDARVRFEVRKLAVPLDLGDNEIDVVLTQDLLECLETPAAFVAEIARILKPGGQVVASHHDWGTQVYVGSDRDRTRRVLRAWSEWKQAWMEHADPWMGRKLWGLFHGSGYFEGHIETRTMTNTVFEEGQHGHTLAQAMRSLVRREMVSASDYEAFIGELEELHKRGEYFWSTTRFVYVGRRTAG
jgi:ubiquinone/menaquinone biosynthesis C-methylase UbiE